MNLVSRLLYCLGLTLLALGCTKDKIPIEGIDFDSSAVIPFDVVVYGGILTQRGKQLVMLSTPGRWPIKDSNTPISHASVTVSDGENTFPFEESDTPGFYYSVDSIQGEVGKAYTLTVTIGDKKYMARDTLVECKIEGINIPLYGVRHNNNRIGIQVNSHIFGYEIPIRVQSWGYVPEGSIYTDSLSPRSILFASSFDIMLHAETPPNGVFNAEGYIRSLWGNQESVFLLYFLSISPSYYQFLLDFFSMTAWSTGLFHSNPGNIRTNLSSGASGFFFASDVKIVPYSMMDLLEMYPRELD